jgi:hypothetical protein
VLANLFMHYAFDAWMAREFPEVRFERYVDDAVVHCRSRVQARMLVEAIGQRMQQVGLRLHPEKTKIVYCARGGGGRVQSTRRSRFWATPSAPGPPGTGTGRSSPRSCLRSARTR